MTIPHRRDFLIVSSNLLGLASTLLPDKNTSCPQNQIINCCLRIWGPEQKTVCVSVCVRVCVCVSEKPESSE